MERSSRCGQQIKNARASGTGYQNHFLNIYQQPPLNHILKNYRKS
jgi:hypothetical protein